MLIYQQRVRCYNGAVHAALIKALTVREASWVAVAHATIVSQEVTVGIRHNGPGAANHVSSLSQ